MEPLKPVSCPECGRVFTPFTARQRFCSKECFLKGTRSGHPVAQNKEPEIPTQPAEKPRAPSPATHQTMKKPVHQTVKKPSSLEPGKEPEVLTDSLGRKRSPHRYKYGKQEELLSFQDIQERVEASRKDLSLESLAYFWLLYYTGVRKSEAYERTIEDGEITDSLFIIDFHQRKKHGAQVPALKLPRSFPGVDVLCEQLLWAQKRKPSKKLIIYSPEKGRKETQRVRAQWLFPHINRTWADQIVKRVLGKEYYPHFLRLNRLTEIGSDESASLTRLKSFSGIKSIKAMEAYLGVTEKEQDAAIDFMAKQIKRSGVAVSLNDRKE